MRSPPTSRAIAARSSVVVTTESGFAAAAAPWTLPGETEATIATSASVQQVRNECETANMVRPPPRRSVRMRAMGPDVERPLEEGCVGVGVGEFVVRAAGLQRHGRE